MFIHIKTTPRCFIDQRKNSTGTYDYHDIESFVQNYKKTYMMALS